MTAGASAPSLRDEPALSFWLSYAEREGALVEPAIDSALVLLPAPLQAECELPEEVTITASPDVAREDGATLLIPGHPAVERAASSVLATGDAGRGYLPWPRSRRPSRADLVAQARKLVAVEHGRIDGAGEPIGAYLPLLRVAVMVSHAASLTLRFQEQEEILLDATTRQAPGERLHQAVAAGRWLPERDGSASPLNANLPAAVVAAHTLLERRAFERGKALASHAQRAMLAELARADAYYEQALASIERRRATAASDRARLLDAQKQATGAEWSRRRREIEDEYRPRHEMQPFRLQLIYAPAYVLPVDVRRGSRAFSFQLTWIPADGAFAASRCPACGAAEPLVATRGRLGCLGCS
ncbi:MAG TPA: hypothetical protein VGI07_08400 [Solirubrobacteraceae bacterium]